MDECTNIILSFDMETDIGSWTSGTKGITEGTPAILDVLARRGVSATFLWVGREAERHPKLVRRCLDAGHEIGCHTMFHETVGQPVYDVPVGGFMLDTEMASRLEMATDAVERAAGIRPVSFRAPRLFGSTAMIDALERLGYLIDSSLPAYVHGRGFHPYHPHRDNWLKEGDRKIIELPPFYDTNTEKDACRERDQWPMMRMKGPDWFAKLTTQAAQQVGTNGALAVYLHPWEFIAMPEKTRCDECSITFDSFIYQGTGQAAINGLDRWLGLMQDQGFSFITMHRFASNVAL